MKTLFVLLSIPVILGAYPLKASAQNFAIQNRYGGRNLCLQQKGFNLTLEQCDPNNNSQKWKATKHYFEWHILQNVQSKRCLWFDRNQLTFKKCIRSQRNDKKNLWKGIGGDIFSGNSQNVKITVWDKEGQCLTYYRTKKGEEIEMESCAHTGGPLKNKQDWRRINY